VNLGQIRAVIADADGTLWRGSRPVAGLVDFFDLLQARGIPIMVVTNNTVKTPEQYRQKLAGFGLAVGTDCVLTASVATVAYLTKNFQPAAPVYVIGQSGLRRAVQEAGFTLLNNADQPAAAVVVGGDTLLTYNKLKHAILLIQKGAGFIGTNPDLLVPTEEGFVPEAGTTLAAIQAATGVSPIIIGKPEPPLFEMALEKMGIAPQQTAMLGDRLETDILGGQRAGLKTILVTTGIDNRETIVQKGIRPDAIFSGLRQLVKAWQKGASRM